ncbi:MAG: hypothetical protein K0Q72_4645, partial [Armatimonadetes bacterium]|nr:hypothetical protein [Armatimonadota bacterium]
IALAAYLWDEGSGINPDTIEVLLNGKPIDPDEKPYYERSSEERKGWTYDPVRRLVRYATPKGEKDQPEQPLLNGRQKIQIQAADWKGNFSSLEWTFVVDNSLPRNAVAVKPKTKAGAGGPGGYPGGDMGDGGGGYPGSGGGYPGAAGPGGAGRPGGTFQGRTGAYQYSGRGGNQGYGFGGRNQGGYGGGGMQRGGAGGMQRGGRGRGGLN